MTVCSLYTEIDRWPQTHTHTSCSRMMENKFVMLPLVQAARNHSEFSPFLSVITHSLSFQKTKWKKKQGEVKVTFYPPLSPKNLACPPRLQRQWQHWPTSGRKSLMYQCLLPAAELLNTTKVANTNTHLKAQKHTNIEFHYFVCRFCPQLTAVVCVCSY